ncbi:AAA family ATPase [Luteimicrobium subarcticum]|uniref:Adenylate kinase family enzyme n=1 Tax=Luteimicrobium subarcticum TaxID=620910 RepID=A0A2M8WJA5_9MICO|nr:AAA family ATPase [Luteimicrobium subarcticum]PJI91011.1 adenylate kinase family enzyme [Luteimicrobium subarcticum]
MTVLGADDDVVAALGHVPRRVAVAGVSGSGKTTLAGRVGAVLGLPHTEIDGLFHGPGWTRRPEFLDDVAALLAQDAWAVEYQYRQVRPRIAERAEVVVWLDLPTRVTMWQVVVRTVRRRVRRVELWNGNLEPPLWTLVRRSDENIVWWSWSTRRSLDGLDAHLAAEHPHLVVVRLRSHRAADRWLRRLGASAGSAADRPGQG